MQKNSPLKKDPMDKETLMQTVDSIHKDIHVSGSLSPDALSSHSSPEPIKDIINKHLALYEKNDRERLENEFFQHGPLNQLLNDETLKEIIINSDQEIWIDRDGSLERQKNAFLSKETFHRWFLMFCEQSNTHVNISTPFANGKWKNFRVHIITNPVSENGPIISLRRHPNSPWTLKKLNECQWASNAAFGFIYQALKEKKNFLIVGPTSSGKTSVLNAFLQELPKNERCIILEDTAELVPPNTSSVRLMTRFDPNDLLKDIHLSDLVKQSLRMRPDRLIIGEIRGDEAKDLLLAMATGHRGCAGTLHARNTQEAITRLEMLIQLGAPQWSLSSIRNLIQSTIDFIIVVEKNSHGKRQIKEVTELQSVESFGITLSKVFS